MNRELFEGLNEAQRAAVEQVEGPSLVIAGAGSGKTRVLTYRIANLLSKGVKPSSILALTFTNKAAREMKGRIDSLLGGDVSRYLWMGTFHSVFSRILRMESERLGYPSSFSIYDTQDSKNLIKTIISEMQLDDKTYKPGDVFGRISAAKNNLITPQNYNSNTQVIEKDKSLRRPLTGQIYQKYMARCKKAGAMDFDDLLLNTNILFRDFQDVLAAYQNKFTYVLVDEYQDTNFSQYLIVKKLAEKHKNVCVVGDDAQSIYSFRGALIENILNFRKDYPNYEIYKLEQNYRSTQTIVDAANSVIAKNKDQIKKTVFSKNDVGERIEIVKAITDAEEGYIVSNSIQDNAMGQQLQYSDFAILYRTNSQSRIFEEALRKRNIPYKVYGSISFYQRKEIKDMLGYLRLLVNPSDDEALKRVINYPARGIGKTTLTKVEQYADNTDKSIWEVINNINPEVLKLNKGTVAKIKGFVDLIKSFQAKINELDAYQLAYEMASASGIMKDLYNGTTPEERSKYENLEELLNGIREYSETEHNNGEAAGLQSFLENVSLLTDADTDKPDDMNKVSIMTVHASKGLEFQYVYIAGMEEELFPSRMSMDSQRDLEEERRLFYVAVTRAMRKVFITYTQSRYRWGNPVDCQPSRFITDIDEQFINWPQDPRNAFQQRETADVDDGFFLKQRGTIQKKTITRVTPQAKQALKLRNQQTAQADFKSDPPEAIKSGMQVEHARFGVGRIVRLEGELPNTKATVFFQSIKQEKQLLLKFAKLRIVRNN